MLPNMGSTQEVAVDYSSSTAESITGGLLINMIPKTGGNMFSGSLVRDRRELVVRRQQQQRRADRARAAHAEQPEASIRHQPRVRRTDRPRPAVDLHLRPVHPPGELRRRPVPQQERVRHHEVELRARHERARGQQRHRAERQPPADLAGERQEQGQLLLRSALALSVRRDQPDHLGRGGQPHRVPDQRSAVGGLHGDADQPAARSRRAPESGAKSTPTRRTPPTIPAGS